MTKVVRIVVPERDFSESYVAYTPPHPFPTLGGALYAGYVFGSDYTDYAELEDISGNGRSLTKTGTPTRAAESTLVDYNAYYQTPFTATALATANEAASIVAWIKPSGLETACLYVTAGSATTPFVDSYGIQSSTTSVLQAASRVTTTQTAAILDDATRGVAFDMAAGVFHADSDGGGLIEAYHQSPNGALRAAATVPSHGASPVGANQFRIGSAYGSPSTAPFAVAGVAFYDRDLTEAEIGLLRYAGQTWFGSFGLDV